MSRSSRSVQQPNPTLSDLLFSEIARVIEDETGVQLGEKQHAMVHSRLTKRMLDLGLTGEDAYRDYFKHNRISETQALVSLLTTHHTYFFREYSHFEFLQRELLKGAIERVRARGDRTIRIWSAACSRGHEVYSLAMFLKAHLQSVAPDVRFEILGTDVDPESVAIAKNGVYRWEELKEVPAAYLQNHWVKGTGEIASYAKVKPELKASCKFEVANLLKLDAFKDRQFDFIFCRNVFIYFNQLQVKALSEVMLKMLYPEGAFFVGLSESLNGLQLPIVHLGPSIYRLQSVAPKPSIQVQPTRAAPEKKIRVLCVDDSPTILALLKKVLSTEKGFHVVGTAGNGVEAHRFLSEHSVDVVTLDLHMPEMNGVEYLEKHFRPGHPPVVVVSSVSREDAAVGLRALTLGASDYVEKPTLNNLLERGEEIVTKLKAMHQLGQAGDVEQAKSLSKSFAHKVSISNCVGKKRILVFGAGRVPVVQKCVLEFSAPQPPTFGLLYGSPTLVSAVAEQIRPGEFQSVQHLDAKNQGLKPGNLGVGDFQECFSGLADQWAQENVHVLVFDELPPRVLKSLTSGKFRSVRFFVNEAAPKTAKAILAGGYQVEVLPAISFAYHSIRDWSGAQG